jgi:hypothetical protein
LGRGRWNYYLPWGEVIEERVLGKYIYVPQRNWSNQLSSFSSSTTCPSGGLQTMET